LRTQNIAKGTQTQVGIWQVVEHAGANDLIERESKLPNVFNRQLMDLEVLQVILLCKSRV